MIFSCNPALCTPTDWCCRHGGHGGFGLGGVGGVGVFGLDAHEKIKFSQTHVKDYCLQNHVNWTTLAI